MSAPSATAIPAFPDACILVVEDVATNVEILCHILRKCGYRSLHTAMNGLEALEKTRTLRPDLVILDLLMPVMDGFAYCEEIRRDAAFETMPILVQTTLDEQENRVRVLALGASDFMSKPISATELALRCKIQLEYAEMQKELRRLHDGIRRQVQDLDALLQTMPDGGESGAVRARLLQYRENLTAMLTRR